LRLQTIDLASSDVSDVPITGDLTTITTGRALVHDVDGDRYLYFLRDSVYAIDPNTGASTLISHVPAPVVSVENRAAYFAKLGGIAYLPRFSSNIWFMPTR
jgi:hypothetical protein